MSFGQSYKLITYKFLKKEHEKNMRGSMKYKRKWIEFCEWCLEYDNLQVFIKKAKFTVSRYIRVKNNKNEYCTIRFSNHKPNKQRELNKSDCDFLVGVTHIGKTQNTEDAKQFIRDKLFGKTELGELNRSNDLYPKCFAKMFNYLID